MREGEFGREESRGGEIQVLVEDNWYSTMNTVPLTSLDLQHRTIDD